MNQHTDEQHQGGEEAHQPVFRRTPVIEFRWIVPDRQQPGQQAYEKEPGMIEIDRNTEDSSDRNGMTKHRGWRPDARPNYRPALLTLTGAVMERLYRTYPKREGGQVNTETCSAQLVPLPEGAAAFCGLCSLVNTWSGNKLKG